MGATCVLRDPHNSTLDQLAQTLNPSLNNYKTLAARYFDSMCLDSFTQGVPLSNFVPPPPSPAPSDDPDPRFDEGLWNFTVAPPTTVHGQLQKKILTLLTLLTVTCIKRNLDFCFCLVLDFVILMHIVIFLVTSPPTLPLSIHEPVRCTCSMQGTGFSCPSGVGGRPPLTKVVTGDILVDITSRNVSEYLLFTSDRVRLHR